MAGKPKPSAVIFAKDIKRLAKFYQELISMSIVLADKDHIVLDAEHFQLVIHGIPKRIADTFEITSPPEIREDTAIKICLPVASIASARANAPSLGGMINAAKNEWEARGFRACDGHDPEGNVFQVRESVQ